MYLAFYKNKNTGVIERVDKINTSLLEAVETAVLSYNQNEEYKETVLVKEATEYEEYLYNRADCNIKNFKEELADIECSINGLADRIGYLTD